MVNSGYIRIILKLFPNTMVPIKRNSKEYKNSNSKSKEEIVRINNKQISIDRIVVENVIGDLKKYIRY